MRPPGTGEPAHGSDPSRFRDIGWVGLLGTGQVVLAARQGSLLVAIWLAALVLWLGVTAYHASLEPAFRSWEERRRPSDEAGVAGPAPPEAAP